MRRISPNLWTQKVKVLVLPHAHLWQSRVHVTQSYGFVSGVDGNDFNCKRHLIQARSFSLHFNPLWSVHLFFQQGGIISLQEINGITIVGPPPQRVFGHPSLVLINYVMKMFFIFISEIIILIKLVIIIFILAIEGTWWRYPYTVKVLNPCTLKV